MSTRNDATERVSLPQTHPLANSIAPTASPTSVRPPASKGTPAWQVGVAALALIGLGITVARLQSRGEQHNAQDERSAASAQIPDAPGTPPSPLASPSQSAAPAPVSAPAEPATAPEPPTEPAPAALPEQAGPPAPPVAEQSRAPVEGPVSAQADSAESEHHHHHGSRTRQVAAGPIESAAQTAPEAPADPAVGSEPPLEATRPPARTAHVKTGPVPAQPDRAQVVAAMNAIADALKSCVGDKHGTASVTLTVRSQGFVSYALVDGSFAGTPEGSCIARVVKQAAFPAFSDPMIRITYPLAF